jgi:hypothetical protein
MAHPHWIHFTKWTIPIHEIKGDKQLKDFLNLLSELNTFKAQYIERNIEVSEAIELGNKLLNLQKLISAYSNEEGKEIYPSTHETYSALRWSLLWCINSSPAFATKIERNKSQDGS